MRRSLLLALLLSVSCAPVPPPKPPTPPTPTDWYVDVIACSADENPCQDQHAIVGANVQLHYTDGYESQVSDGKGYTLWKVPSTLVESDTIITAPKYVETHAHIDVAATHDGRKHNVIYVPLTFPEPPTRDQVLRSTESFQGAVLQTHTFGNLFWWPTAFSSLPDLDRHEAYTQFKSWGDTDVTVAWKWDYGEPGQPYGSGQLVPPRDFTGNPQAFRDLVKEVIQNGFIPRVFMSGDDGYDAYMGRYQQIIDALKPQPNDTLDLTRYVKLQMCYDSCIPGWAGPQDDKTKIDRAILATRAACPDCVIALEFSSGYSSTGEGDAWWQTDAGRAIDEADWEGNSWPVSNWEQYWQILDRWLGPAYIKPPEQKSDPDAPFCATCGKFYLRNGTPRGAYLVHCYEPYTYQWVRGQIPMDQVPVAFNTIRGLGCPAIDTPQPRN